MSRDGSRRTDCCMRAVLHATANARSPTDERRAASTIHSIFLFCSSFFAAQCYASAVLATGLCLSVRVRLSQVGVISKRTNESGWFLAWELHSTYPTLCYKEIHVTSKIRVLFSGILLQTLDLENFATAYRSSKRVINFARER